MRGGWQWIRCPNNFFGFHYRIPHPLRVSFVYCTRITVQGSTSGAARVSFRLYDDTEVHRSDPGFSLS